MMRSGLLLLLLFLAVPGFSFAASPAIESACKDFLEPDFCITSLQSVPGSESADIAGLASIAHNLSVANATATVAKIEAFGKNSTDSGVKNSVEACLILYKNSLSPLRFAAEFKAAKHYDTAASMYQAAFFAPERCGGLVGNGFNVAGDHFFKLMLLARKITWMIKSSS